MLHQGMAKQIPCTIKHYHGTHSTHYPLSLFLLITQGSILSCIRYYIRNVTVIRTNLIRTRGRDLSNRLALVHAHRTRRMSATCLSSPSLRFSPQCRCLHPSLPIYTLHLVRLSWGFPSLAGCDVLADENELLRRYYWLWQW